MNYFSVLSFFDILSLISWKNSSNISFKYIYLELKRLFPINTFNNHCILLENNVNQSMFCFNSFVQCLLSFLLLIDIFLCFQLFATSSIIQEFSEVIDCNFQNVLKILVMLTQQNRHHSLNSHSSNSYKSAQDLNTFRIN